MSQNYPNPFNPNTKIRFDISSNVNRQTSDVKLKVYDALGKEIIALVNQKLSLGSYEVDFDAGHLPSGTYFYQMTSDDFADVKKMILLR